MTLANHPRLPGDWQPGEKWTDIPSWTCGHCGALTVSARTYASGSASDVYAWIRICNGCNRPNYFEGNLRTPGALVGRRVPDVPKEVNVLYEEARAGAGIGAHTSAVLALRKLLMHIAVERGAKAGLAFLAYVQYLGDKGYVPPDGQSWVDRIRRKGNEANHEIVMMDEAASKELLNFTEMLLRFMYEFPARMALNTNDTAEDATQAQA